MGHLDLLLSKCLQGQLQEQPSNFYLLFATFHYGKWSLCLREAFNEIDGFLGQRWSDSLSQVGTHFHFSGAKIKLTWKVNVISQVWLEVNSKLGLSLKHTSRRWLSTLRNSDWQIYQKSSWNFIEERMLTINLNPYLQDLPQKRARLKEIAAVWLQKVGQTLILHLELGFLHLQRKKNLNKKQSS